MVKALVQRVSEAAVHVAEARVGAITAGLLVFLGVEQGDTKEQADWLVEKIVGLRIFPDHDKPMNRSVLDTGGALLVVSQFTLAADTSRGKRPSFGTAASPEIARELYDYFVTSARQFLSVQTGQFGADMQVHLVNDGPVTFWLERQAVQHQI